MSDKPTSSTASQDHRCHAFTEDVIGNLDAIGIAHRLNKGEISHAELIEAASNRAHKVDPTIQAVALDCSHHAFSASTSGESVFSGIPTYIKDNTPVSGMTTQFGSQSIQVNNERNDGPYTKQYRKLGFSFLGKSTMPEFGLNATTEPAHGEATRNPWNVNFSTGASSGGSAALVAAGVVPIAHGNDGGGSIRIPAACCGLVGLKPSRGRHIDSTHASQLPINIVSEGVLTRSVRDTAHFHYEMQKHFKNKKLPDLPLVTGPGEKRLKIGLITDSLSGHVTDAETRDAVVQTAILLQQQGHEVSEVPFPVKARFADDFAFYWAMMAFMLRLTGKLSIHSSFQAANLDDFSHGLADFYKPQAYKTPTTLYRLKRHGEDFKHAFNNYDVLLTPVLTHLTPPLQHLSPVVPFEELFDRLTRYVGFTPMANVAGTPALSLPLGMSEQGLPIGVQFCAGFGNEKTLLELAYELEEIKPWVGLHG